MTDLDTIAALCTQFPDWRNCVQALRGRGDVHAPDLIEQMAEEIVRLRADRTRLDLEGVPSGYSFEMLWYDGGTIDKYGVILRRDRHSDVDGYGPTPAAALADAVGRCR
jgi:hypothetical protein